MSTYNIYCDESCHLPNDRQPIMVLGAVWCPLEKTKEIAVRIREIKSKHKLAADFEIKWTKVSPGQLHFYRDVLDYFFDDDDLRFRSVVAEKIMLDHQAFGQDHDTWYYKMLFLTLQTILKPENKYRIYLDIKDTRSQKKVNKLREVLCNAQYDFNRRIVEHIQQVRSHEVEQMQLTDLLIGALCYANRGKKDSPAKMALIDRIQKRTGYSLKHKTLLGESKFNIFLWTPQEAKS